MQKSQPTAHKGAFSVNDALYVLFKHKWLILSLSLLGLAAAAAVFLVREPIFESRARLSVNYVVERSMLDPYDAQQSPGSTTSNTIINTEIEILTSTDLALEVAESIGIEKLLPESGGQATLSDAAGAITKNLKVTMGTSAKVLYVHYGNKDPKLAKEVLTELVQQYLAKHLDIHRSAASFDLVEKQTEEVFARLKQTELELNRLRIDSGIVSLAEATSALAAQRSKTHEDLIKAKAELAEQQASIHSLEKKTGTSGLDATQAGARDAAARIPQQVLTEYRAVCELLDFFRKRDIELRIKFKPGNRLLELNQQQISANDAKRRAMIEKYQGLEEAAAMALHTDEDPNGHLVMEKARLAAITAKIAAFDLHLKEIDERFRKDYAIGAQIEELDRRRQMEDEEYRSFQAKLKNARLDQTLDPSRMPNIKVLEHPIEPFKTYDPITNKIMLGFAGGGMGLGLGLAFLIELIFDRRVKRPIEIQARLQLPLLLTIPYIRRKERGGLLLDHEARSRRIGMNGDHFLSPPDPEEEDLDGLSRRLAHFILPYSETIRDRIIFNFEVNNLTHKPKLVAVTGLCDGAGASTIAAGLAKSFSEIPGIKVLLVDLSSCHPEENPIFGEIPRHSLNGALHLACNAGFRQSAQSLYYASATARRDQTGLTTFSPVHLYELMPKLRACDYDYIIFDMPPVDQTSRTLTMAGLMDKVLLVLDAENTSRDALLWGYSELTKGRADVSCIFNKTRTHVPGWLIGEN
jgi:uncharacterized protein involved in exopolysaccharide biosynthesis/Mrp family chromosome partitioning ATPase